MPKYLVEASYTAEGLKGLIKDKAAGRKAVVAQALADLGGKLDGIYFTMGERDVLLLCECPDYASVAALGLAAARTALLKRSGWNVEEDGLFGAPPIRVVVGEEAHVSLLKPLALFGVGTFPRDFCANR